ncbi:hypothetical protein OOJ09_04000 [Mesorhizobium qingshengii]|uniref:Uncharacterized protein n=1 Tax=Mesorhizobium qingshengii TaxID=1165689 RepID=A0ABT4QPH1_9HYPH|nr:hypothetical protein [Mesorhizobium qingshengii]MCZ8543328.1 hypothetical protein [Mesorhizobium qingshengii]
MSPKSAQRFWDNDMHEREECMSPRSAQRFWDNDMHKREECMSPRSAQRFWDNDMHHTLRRFIAIFGWPIDFGLLTPHIRI